jgi:hypothetical protein
MKVKAMRLRHRPNVNPHAPEEPTVGAVGLQLDALESSDFAAQLHVTRVQRARDKALLVRTCRFNG